MVKEHKFNLKKTYKNSWNYLKDSKKLFWVVIVIFIISFFVGFFISFPEVITSRILEFIKSILAKTDGMGGFQLIRFIFLNNIQSSFFSMVFGVFLGIFPIFSIISNGFLLGFVAHLTVSKASVLSLWRIFPHGIFELPAMIISFTLGIRIGFSLLDKKRFGDFKGNLYSSLWAFLLFVLPLLIIAAIIEGSLIFLGI